MSKNYFKRNRHKHEAIRDHRYLRIFGKLLHSPNLWHMNRRSVAGAVANGLFMAFIPVPFQMVLAAGSAILLKVNLPLSVALVWITNPVTMGPIFYGTYRVGNWLMDKPHGPFEIELTFEWMMNEFLLIWQPLLLGSLVCGAIAAMLGYIIIRIYWRSHVIGVWKKRLDERKANKSKKL
jgi:uncharacterized protein (DUF2062 family)